MAAGHTVCLATHLAFEDMVRSYCIPFFALADEPKEFFKAEGGGAWLNQGAHPSRFAGLLAQEADRLPLFPGKPDSEKGICSLHPNDGA
jgi:hypothetical protein